MIRWRAIGVRVPCLALGAVDLTSATGRVTMQVIAAVAEFERDLLVERTQARIESGAQHGEDSQPAGKPERRTERQIVARLDAGSSVSALPREYQPAGRPSFGRGFA